MNGVRGSREFQKLVGEKLLRGKDGEVEVSSLFGQGKFIALYFSAHFCGPCREFTLQLVHFYEEFKAKHPKSADFDIVFVSQDKDEESFSEYYGEMTWLALPYSEKERKRKLNDKFNQQGMPKLVIINAESGSIITRNGREVVEQDPQGKEFPWNPKPVSDLLKGPLINKDDQLQEDYDEFIKDKYVLLYFSAHWCPPCRRFTPKLAEFYKALKQERNDFEIIYVSQDRDEQQFKEYLSEMPWWSVPYGDVYRRMQLVQEFGIETIPVLVVLDPQGNILTKEGRSKVTTVPQEFPWTPKAVPLLRRALIRFQCCNSRG
eukprot:TRINITY_DN38316_c1_g6_i1.p1 TRINITY_DN38316_c1_g6~~TRINITY_DN38316_c1_g6_i1.p1  ORF type:complete len:318 (-),score=39.01 TRINITY_DN38316_c1_g6_i1:212-1165(-)